MESVSSYLIFADRNLLADQAYNSFSAFEDDALVRIRQVKYVLKEKYRPMAILLLSFKLYVRENDTPFFGQYPKIF